jgi:hypothetical protein
MACPSLLNVYASWLYPALVMPTYSYKSSRREFRVTCQISLSPASVSFSPTETKDFPSGGKEHSSRRQVMQEITVIMTMVHEHRTQRANNALRPLLKTSGFPKLLAVFLVFSVLTTSVHAQANVTLAWNPSTNLIVAGFNIYYGWAILFVKG